MQALSFWRALYRCLLTLAYPLVRLRLRWRARREPEYGRRVEERFGQVPDRIPTGPIWFHTVSAGETIAAAPLIERLADEFPDLPFLVTTMTPTGSSQVSARLGNRVAHCYAPYDFPGAVRRFYDRVQPRLLVLMETELWPNLLQEARQRGVHALLVNGRLSERSARGYGRIGALTRAMIGQLDFIACQYPDHVSRFVKLGAAPDKVAALGSVKFDLTLPADHAVHTARLADRWQLEGRPVWIAGSTHPGEEAPLLAAHARVRQRLDDAVLILVPRHPSRAGEVAELVRQAGFEFAMLSAAGPQAGRPAAVLVGDTMGELLTLYGLARVAFLGGSLVEVGGHNPIEAAICGQPLLMGPRTFNFAEVVAAFTATGCLTITRDPGEIATAVLGYLTDPACRDLAAARAVQVVRDNAGATDRLLERLRAAVSAARKQP